MYPAVCRGAQRGKDPRSKIMRTRLQLCWLFVAVCSCDAGGGGEPDAGPDAAVDPSDAVFDEDRVLEVSIQIDEDDWDALRLQERHYLDVLGETCNVSPPVSPFTYFPATVAVDGEVTHGVGVRKKGFFGSISDEKPSLKLKFDEYASGQTFAGLTHLTLNNNLADPSQIKQCLGYRLFRQAGVAAPRCNLAVVEVNGRPLGTYSNVEPIKRTFIARHFASDGGNLYEGTLADFRPGWVDMFERETNEDDPDRSDVEALVAALEVDDDALLETVGELVDLDRFYDYWAMEVILMHGDGYARNTNNFYIYNDPTTGRFSFVPWGIDVILQPDQTWSWEQEPPPGVAWAVSALTRRLYLHPTSQAAYLERLQQLLDEVWDEEEILSEIDRMTALLAPHLTAYQEFIAKMQDEVRDYVVTRRAALEAILAQPPAVWDEPLRDPWCLDRIGEVAGDFAGSWGTLDADDPFAEGDGQLDLTVGSEIFEQEQAAVVAGHDASAAPVIRVLYRESEERAFVIEIPLDELDLDAALPHDFEIAPGEGAVHEILYSPLGDPVSIETLALFGGGSLLIEQLGLDAGAAVAGSFDASLYPYQD